MLTLPLRALDRLLEDDVLRPAALLAAAVFAVDAAVKSWGLQHLAGAAVPVGSLVLGIERNEAFAFSSGSGWVPAWVVLGTRTLALCALALLLVRVAASSRQYASGCALILGGGAGNTADVAFREGGVVDFIGVYQWAADAVHLQLVFNTADVAIVVGLGLLSPLIRDYALALQQRLKRREAGWRARLARRRSLPSAGSVRRGCPP